MTVYVKALPVEQLRRKPIRLTKPVRTTFKILVPVLVVVGWQLGSAKVSGASFSLPFPSQVLLGFKELWQNGSIEAAIPASLARAGLGLLVGLAIGIPFGVLNGLFRTFEDLFDATFQIVRVIPFIALVPLFIIWFGIGEQMKIILNRVTVERANRVQVGAVSLSL